MAYVKKDNVVKEVSDNVYGCYLAIGWQPATTNDYKKANDVKVHTKGKAVTRRG